eukprot:m.306356 g.306356  ORF g.306356 m.306356 type:complete len:69 (+) comp41182_c0_seq1:164-370(+)
MAISKSNDNNRLSKEEADVHASEVKRVGARLRDIGDCLNNTAIMAKGREKMARSKGRGAVQRELSRGS